MAIGAQRRDVLGLVLSSGLGWSRSVSRLGLAGAFALTRVLQTLLFGVTAHDPLTFAGNAALLVAVATRRLPASRRCAPRASTRSSRCARNK